MPNPRSRKAQVVVCGIVVEPKAVFLTIALRVLTRKLQEWPNNVVTRLRNTAQSVEPASAREVENHRLDKICLRMCRCDQTAPELGCRIGKEGISCVSACLLEANLKVTGHSRN